MLAVVLSHLATPKRSVPVSNPTAVPSPFQMGACSSKALLAKRRQRSENKRAKQRHKPRLSSIQEHTSLSEASARVVLETTNVEEFPMRRRSTSVSQAMPPPPISEASLERCTEASSSRSSGSWCDPNHEFTGFESQNPVSTHSGTSSSRARELQAQIDSLKFSHDLYVSQQKQFNHSRGLELDVLRDQVSALKDKNTLLQADLMRLMHAVEGNRLVVRNVSRAESC